MTANESIATVPPKGIKSVVRGVIGLILGGLAGAGAVRLLETLHVSLKGMPWSDFMAFLLGLMFFVLGAITMAVSASRKYLAQEIQSEDKTMPATNEEVRSFRLQGLTLLLAGVMLLALVAAPGTLKTHPDANIGIFGTIVVLFVAQSFVNYRIWMESDEFVRAMMLQLATMTFWIVQSGIFLWAAAEHLHLVRAATSWEIANVLFFCYLIVSFVVAIRYRP